VVLFFCGSFRWWSSVLIFDIYYLRILLFRFLDDSLPFHSSSYLGASFSLGSHMREIKLSYVIQHYPHYNVTVLYAQMSAGFVFRPRIESTLFVVRYNWPRTLLCTQKLPLFLSESDGKLFRQYKIIRPKQVCFSHPVSVLKLSYPFNHLTSSVCETM
jgi:hypothetical protein